MFNTDLTELKTIGAEITTGEIKQQPELWLETLKNYHEQESELNNFISSITTLALENKIRVIFTGAGTSQYVGDTLVSNLNRSGKYKQFIFESIATTDIVSDPSAFLYPDEITLLVSFARSGNSPESIAAVEIATKIVKNIYHLMITSAPEGALAKLGKDDAKSFVLLQPELSNDKGFAMTGSFSCMMLSALLIFDEYGLTEKAQFVQYISELGREVIARESEILDIVQTNFNRVVYLGSGDFVGLAHEAQLKILELTAGKIATLFDSSMGFRHGPKSFIDDKTLVFVFESNSGYTRQYDIDILNEIQNDGEAARVVAIGQSLPTNFDGKSFEFSTKLIPLPDSYLALPNIMFAQTIALLTSVKVKNTPDTPSASGTVNRVVKGVTIHDY